MRSKGLNKTENDNFIEATASQSANSSKSSNSNYFNLSFKLYLIFFLLNLIIFGYLLKFYSHESLREENTQNYVPNISFQLNEIKENNLNFNNNSTPCPSSSISSTSTSSTASTSTSSTPSSSSSSGYRYPFFPDNTELEEELMKNYHTCSHEIWCNVPPPKTSFFSHSLGEEIDLKRWKRAQAMAASSEIFILAIIYFFYFFFSFITY